MVVTFSVRTFHSSRKKFPVSASRPVLIEPLPQVHASDSTKLGHLSVTQGGSRSGWPPACSKWPSMHAVATSILLLAAPVFAGEPSEPAVGAPLLVKSVSVRGTNLHVNLATQVGELYDVGVVGKDVRRLWSMGRFQDIRVEAAEEPEGVSVVFHVLESRQLRLHEIHIEPSTFGLKLALPEGTPLNRPRTHEIALQAPKQLQTRGYLDAQVDYGLTPFAGSEVDLRLSITASGPVRVKEVAFAGDP